jgi:PilZ domain
MQAAFMDLSYGRPSFSHMAGALRRWNRKHLDVPVMVQVHSSRVVAAMIRDISREGAGLHAQFELQPGAEIMILFDGAICEGRSLTVRATVRNRRDYRYGVEFLSYTDAEEHDLATLRRLVQNEGTDIRTGTPEDRR